MAMNKIALFKGVRIQPYQEHIDFMFVGVLAFIFLIYRMYILFIDYKSVDKKLDIWTLFAYSKPHLLYLLIGTAIMLVIYRLIAQLLIRFRTKDLAEMIETRDFHGRTVIRKTTEYIPIDYKQVGYNYYPTMFYKHGKETFVIHTKKDGSRFQDNYLELGTIIEPMFNSELVGKKHIGRYLRYEFMSLKCREHIVISGEQESNTIFYDTKIAVTHQTTWDFMKAPHGLVTGIAGGGKTCFLLYVIRELFRRRSEVRLLDPKVSGLSFMKHVISDDEVAGTKGQILKQSREVNNEMEERFRSMNDSSDYRIGNDFRSFDMRPYFIISGEVTAFTSALDKEELQEMNDYLISIIMRSHQAGVFMFLTTQRPDAGVIKGGVHDQLGLRVSLDNLSNDGYHMTFGQTDREFQTIHDSDIGRGYISILGQYDEPILSDAPLMEQYDFVEDVKQILNRE